MDAFLLTLGFLAYKLEDGDFEMKRSHGGYSKSSRNVSTRKTPANRLLADFSVGSRVRIFFHPSFLAGRPNSLRFNHKLGVVKGKRGGAFEVEFNDGGKTKTLVITNVHLKKV